MRARLPKNIGVEETFSLPVSVSKKSRPSSIGEIVRMCEILSQTISQLDDLPSIHEVSGTRDPLALRAHVTVICVAVAM